MIGQLADFKVRAFQTIYWLLGLLPALSTFCQFRKEFDTRGSYHTPISGVSFEVSQNGHHSNKNRAMSLRLVPLFAKTGALVGAIFLGPNLVFHVGRVQCGQKVLYMG